MTLSNKEIQRRARLAAARMARGRRDPRYRRVIGRLAALGLLVTNFEVDDEPGRLRVADVLWVGSLEPRALELLPALIVKSPGMFEDPPDLPPDLDSVVRSLRRGDVPESFRGIPGSNVAGWLHRVGRKPGPPSRLKAFRFRPSDLELLRELSLELGLTETDVLRRALRALAATELLG